LIYPQVVGNSVELPAIWVLCAVTLGGSMFGIMGMLVFIPLLSVLYTLLREQTYARLAGRSAALNAARRQNEAEGCGALHQEDGK
ncbi:MAG: AI-2E family transporter, partial [Eubacteriales bacterium]|nr:AI-2E family transporter [Eubacteriales bacterium]